MSAKDSKEFSEFGVLCHAYSAFQSRDVVRIVEAEASDSSERANWLVVVQRIHGFATVFDKHQLVALTDTSNRVHFARVAVNRHGQYGAGPRPDRLLNPGRADVQRVGV